MATGIDVPVRGVTVWSRKTGNCAPKFSYAELDFEPVLSGQGSMVEFACDASECAELADAFADGVMIELAGTGTHDRDRRQGAPVSARVVVCTVRYSEVDSCEQV